jgi:hypothetical protein
MAVGVAATTSQIELANEAIQRRRVIIVRPRSRTAFAHCCRRPALFFTSMTLERATSTPSGRGMMTVLRRLSNPLLAGENPRCPREIAGLTCAPAASRRLPG